MALITLGSNNPDFSFIISKNPSTIRTSGEPFTRPLRKGNIYGWFSKEDNSEFRLLFKDSDTEVSFGTKHAEFEYLDKSRYDSPYAPIGIITTALASALKAPHEKDTPEFESYLVTNIFIANRAFSSGFVRHFTEGVSISLEPLAGNHYTMLVRGNGVQKVLNMTVAFCLMQALSDKDTYVPLESEAIKSFIRVLNRIEAPYFIRYLFTRSIFQDKNTFLKFKDEIQLPGTVINYGDTRRHRYDAVSKVLAGGETLFDIGCGELFYAKRLAKVYNSIICFDADEEIVETNKRRISSMQLEEKITQLGGFNVEVIENMTSGLDGTDVLLTEVLEHIEKSEASHLLSTLLLKASPNKVCITVPNKEFNVNYLMEEDQFRHDDHKWEPTLAEFEDFIKQALPSDKYIVHISQIGDVVNGVGTSLMAVIQLMKESEA